MFGDCPCLGCRRALANQDRRRQLVRRDRSGLRAHRTGAHQLGQLRERVFKIDLERCPICGGDLKIRAVIIESPVGSRDCA